jgi:hypothetical protein
MYERYDADDRKQDHDSKDFAECAGFEKVDHQRGDQRHRALKLQQCLESRSILLQLRDHWLATLEENSQIIRARVRYNERHADWDP